MSVNFDGGLPHPALRATPHPPRQEARDLLPQGEKGGNRKMIRARLGVNQSEDSGDGLSPGQFVAGKVRPVFLSEPFSWYVEERWVSQALFDEECFGPCVVDPCAGLGNVVASARACGLSAYGSDVIKRARGISGGRDFLSERWRPRRGVKDGFSIVGNPPWGGRLNLLRAFAEAACERAEKVALLAPAHRLAAASWLKALPLKRVLFVSPRPAMWPGPIYLAKTAAGEPLKNGFQDFVWLVFERGFRRRPQTGWLRRP